MPIFIFAVGMDFALLGVGWLELHAANKPPPAAITIALNILDCLVRTLSRYSRFATVLSFLDCKYDFAC